MRRKRLLADFFAGLSVASILLPEAVAYAAIAHLSIQQALVAVIVGLSSYALLGGSSFAIVAPTSSAAALMAAVMLSLHTPDAATAENLGSALVIWTGLILLLFAKARLGKLSAFISRPVLHGFAFALAMTIIIKQLPILCGVERHTDNLLEILHTVISAIPQGSLWSIAIGLGALLLLTFCKLWPWLPASFLVLLVSMLFSAHTNLAEHQVALLGQIPLSLPQPRLPQLSLNKWLELAELACGLMVIIVAESWGSIRSIALGHGQSVAPNRELFALGVGNLLSGCLQGLPVGAGFSASVANEHAGAQSKWAGACAAMILLGTMLFAQDWIAYIPTPVVAAIVINALLHALNPQPIFKLWRQPQDQFLAIAASAAVLLFGVLHGMLIAVGLSLALAIRAFSQPLVKELGELEHTRDYVDRENHQGALTHKHILILRPEEPLFFASVEGIFAAIQTKLAATRATKILILSLEESAKLDSTATEALIEYANVLQQQNIILLLARVKDPINELLEDIAAAQFQDKLFWSVHDAVVAAEQMLQPESAKLVNLEVDCSCR